MGTVHDNFPSSGSLKDYAPVRDDISGKLYNPCCVRQCPEPHVVKKFGVGGVANVTVYTCRKCKYVITYKWFGGVSCGYEK